MMTTADSYTTYVTDAERSALVAMLNRLCTQMTGYERQALLDLLDRTNATA
jgi:hypothetical protein